MKLAFATLAATLLGAALVATSNAADRQGSAGNQNPTPLTERGEPVRVINVSPCEPDPETFACAHSSERNEHRSPPLGAALPPERPVPLRRSALILASWLGAIETFIGIKGDQLNVWRSYAGALQTMMCPPPPQDFKNEPADALAPSAALARYGAELGQRAVKLAAAIDHLRGVLNSEQLERLKEAGPLPSPCFPGPGLGAPAFPPSASFGPRQGPEDPGAGHFQPP